VRSSDSMSVFRRVLAGDECAIVLRRRGEPLLIRGPGSVRTFYRWRQVTVVNLSPFVARALDIDVKTSDGIPVRVSGELRARVVDAVAAALKVVDYEDATQKILHTAMRGLVMGQSIAELREAGRQLDSQLTDTVTDSVRDWGIAVTSLSFDLAVASERDA
jgi:SPFH domain / Band 7 family